MSPNEKVVCVNDKNQRTDVNHAPDGLVVCGSVYTVCRITSKGGIVLTGLRSISKRSGRETGFAARRFVSLAYHRAEFGCSNEAETVKEISAHCAKLIVE